MSEKSFGLIQQEQERDVPDYGIGPIVAAYFLGYLKSEKGDKIADEDIEKLYIGALPENGNWSGGRLVRNVPSIIWLRRREGR